MFYWENVCVRVFLSLFSFYEREREREEKKTEIVAVLLPTVKNPGDDDE
jgi:hypothetical protein